MPLPIAMILATAASAYVCYTIAKERRADARFWVWMGIVLGPLAIPFVFFSNPEKNDH